MKKGNLFYDCKKCGHRWIARSLDKPQLCPKCKSRDYNTSKFKHKK